MRKALLSGLVIWLALMLPSCQNPCKSAYWYYFPIASQLKKDSFKPGTYWVYQDSASGIIDSQSVYYYSAQNHVDIGSQYTGDGSQCIVYGDVFSMSAASFWNGAPHDSIFFGNAANNSGPEITVSHSTQRQYSYGYSATGDKWTDTLTNFSVLGRTFPKVYLSPGYNSQIYHVDNVGVVKWVFNDTINGHRTWDLMRYHVVNP